MRSICLYLVIEDLNIAVGDPCNTIAGENAENTKDYAEVHTIFILERDSLS